MPSTVTLQVQHPDGSSRAFELTEHDTFLLGRMADCHLCLPDDAQVSRHHFLLEACPPQASLRDLGSMNGTHINGKKCGGREKGESPEQGAKRQYPSIDLKHGDRITVGQSSIEVAASRRNKEPRHSCRVANGKRKNRAKLPTFLPPLPMVDNKVHPPTRPQRHEPHRQLYPGPPSMAW